MPANPETGEWIDPPREECEVKPGWVRELAFTCLIFAIAPLCITPLVSPGDRAEQVAFSWLSLFLFVFPLIGLVACGGYRRESRRHQRIQQLEREQVERDRMLLDPEFREWLRECQRRLEEEGILP